MCRMQKIAVFSLIVFGIAVSLAVIATTVLYHLFGWPKAVAGIAFLGISGLAGLAPLIFKKEAGKVTSDERDKLINRTAATGAFACSYVWLCIFGTILIAIDTFDAKFVKKTGLPILIFGAMMIVFVVHSLSVLIMYGRGSNGEE